MKIFIEEDTKCAESIKIITLARIIFSEKHNDESPWHNFKPTSKRPLAVPPSTVLPPGSNSVSFYRASSSNISFCSTSFYNASSDNISFCSTSFCSASSSNTSFCSASFNSASFSRDLRKFNKQTRKT